MKLIESANSPQSARFNWNVDTHVIIATAHTTDPIAEKITSEMGHRVWSINGNCYAPTGMSHSKCFADIPHLHFLIWFCSSYAGFRKASLKNQIVLMAHTIGRNRKPAASSVMDRQNVNVNKTKKSLLSNTTCGRKITSEIPFAQIQFPVVRSSR